MRCETPCYTCRSATECLSCDRTNPNNTAILFFNQDYKCYEECPDISVPTPSKTCIACEDPCVTCENLPDFCTSCGEGMYLHKTTCVESCPFLYFKQDDPRYCLFVGEISLPVPFTIMTLILSIGIGISSFLKGSDKRGRE